MSVVPSVVEAAYERAIATLRAAGVDPDGGCLEASVLMYEDLRYHGRGRARLVRREHESIGGHWTVEFDGVEYDPTIKFWHGGRGGLHVVGPGDPHHDWWRDRWVNLKIAREVVYEQIGMSKRRRRS